MFKHNNPKAVLDAAKEIHQGKRSGAVIVIDQEKREGSWDGSVGFITNILQGSQFGMVEGFRQAFEKITETLTRKT